MEGLQAGCFFVELVSGYNFTGSPDLYSVSIYNTSIASFKSHKVVKTLHSCCGLLVINSHLYQITYDRNSSHLPKSW